MAASHSLHDRSRLIMKLSKVPVEKRRVLKERPSENLTEVWKKIRESDPIGDYGNFCFFKTTSEREEQQIVSSENWFQVTFLENEEIKDRREDIEPAIADSVAQEKGPLIDEGEKENIEQEVDDAESGSRKPGINENINEVKILEQEEEFQQLMFDSDDSNADPNYNASEDTSSSEDSSNDARKEKDDENMESEKKNTGKKGRKRKKAMETWVTISSKKLRNSGKPYKSYKTKKEVKGMELKRACTESCKQKCSKNFTEDERKFIFNNYWQMGDLHRQREFIAASMIKVEPKYRYVREGSNRKANNAFYFEKKGKRVRVCKVFFMNTLDINHRVIRIVVNKKLDLSTSIVSEDLREKHNSHKHIDETLKNGVRQHINSISKIPSHYCRADSSRDYIDGSKTIAQIYTGSGNSASGICSS
ncbi:uncharacterized protein LOC115877193 [Sitophilus oryzae]|uniref:Uncharacterized protein LOC115877193 n=1 Tax=Sitophilus oryzae TaxID=7048 RepID=A0A6J2XD09_SITOR|nr:uncharacterized protein LOC115877193 [Sitophilus oryzae]